jgi:hypothetical protein
MNTKFRTKSLLAGAMGAVVLSSTVSAAGGHAQTREPAGQQSAPHGQTVANNGNHYGTGQRGQGNASGSSQHGNQGSGSGNVNSQHNQRDNQTGGQGSGQHRGNDGGGGYSAPSRGNSGQHNGSSRPPGQVDSKPVPPRSGNGNGNSNGNAWNSHGNGNGHNSNVPSRGDQGQHYGSSRPPGHVDGKPVPPRSGSGNGGGSGNGNGNAWNSHGNDSGHGSNATPRGNQGQNNGSGRPPGHVDGKPIPPRSGSSNGNGNAWNSHSYNKPGNGNASSNGNGNRESNRGKDNWHKEDTRTGDHFTNWSGSSYSGGNGQRYDSVRSSNSHFNNNRSYFDHPGNVYRPPRVVTTLPVGYRHYSWNGGAYYQHAGLWYQPYGTRYVVVGAPYGLSVSYLPSYYSSFWFGGVHYFHADSTYYLYEPAQRSYVVTQSPYESGDEEQGSSGDADEDLYIYPAQGQSEQQQSDDRYECHSWSVEQTGYDPIESDYDEDRRAEYLRAMTACLTGRGYSVR